MPAAYVQVRESFVGSVGKEDIDFRAGELVPSDHPAVKKYPALFVPVASRFESPKVEQATSAPGEKRGRL